MDGPVTQTDSAMDEPIIWAESAMDEPVIFVLQSHLYGK